LALQGPQSFPLITNHLFYVYSVYDYCSFLRIALQDGVSRYPNGVRIRESALSGPLSSLFLNSMFLPRLNFSRDILIAFAIMDCRNSERSEDRELALQGPHSFPLIIQCMSFSFSEYQFVLGSGLLWQTGTSGHPNEVRMESRP